MELASFPSYNTCLWCSARWMSLSDLNLKVLCRQKDKTKGLMKKKDRNLQDKCMNVCHAQRSQQSLFNCGVSIVQTPRISLMNTALTQTIIQLARNKRCTGAADVWERGSQHSKHTVPHRNNTHEGVQTHVVTRVCDTWTYSQFSAGNLKEGRKSKFLFFSVKGIQMFVSQAVPVR